MIYLITGGERSGKSTYAQNLALQLSDSPMYVATARKWDSDFQNRIDRHQQERDERWKNIEKEKDERDIFDMAGSGFASTVRLAKSSPTTWASIFKENKENVSE